MEISKILKTSQIYGLSSKFEFGRWSHRVFKFDDVAMAEKWLDTEEYDFRERELVTKSKAIRLAGQSAVDEAILYDEDYLERIRMW